MRHFSVAALRSAVALSLFVAACGTSGEDTSPPPESLAAAQQTSTTQTSVVADDAAAEQNPPATPVPAATLEDITSSIGQPADADDPDLVRLDDEVTIKTRVVFIVADEGTPGELEFHVAVPADWTFESELGGFTDGQSTMTFETSCAGDCEVKAWSQVLGNEGGFLDFKSRADFGTSVGFSGSTSMGGGSNSIRSEKDDGSGASATAHYSNEAARFIGCSISLEAGDPGDLRTYTELCRSMEIDWTTLVSNSPIPELEILITDDVAALLEETKPQFEYQDVPLDDDGERSARVALPEGAATRAGTFSTTVSLGDGWSIFTDLSLDSTCDGVCQEQDWEPLLNAPGGAIGRMRAGTRPENDTPIPGGWLISGPSARDDDEYNILVTKWNNDATRYFACEAEVDDRDFSRINDLIAICLSADPDWLDS